MVAMIAGPRVRCTKALLWLLLGISFGFYAGGAELNAPVHTASFYQFELRCETNSIYLIEQSTNLVNWSVVARNDAFATNRTVFIPRDETNLNAAFFRAVRTNEPLFRYAIRTKQVIDLNGTN